MCRKGFVRLCKHETVAGGASESDPVLRGRFLRHAVGHFSRSVRRARLASDPENLAAGRNHLCDGCAGDLCGSRPMTRNIN
jgi:hypothetical protein